MPHNRCTTDLYAFDGLDITYLNDFISRYPEAFYTALGLFSEGIYTKDRKKVLSGLTGMYTALLPIDRFIYEDLVSGKHSFREMSVFYAPAESLQAGGWAGRAIIAKGDFWGPYTIIPPGGGKFTIDEPLSDTEIELFQREGFYEPKQEKKPVSIVEVSRLPINENLFDLSGIHSGIIENLVFKEPVRGSFRVAEMILTGDITTELRQAIESPITPGEHEKGNEYPYVPGWSTNTDFESDLKKIELKNQYNTYDDFFSDVLPKLNQWYKVKAEKGAIIDLLRKYASEIDKPTDGATGTPYKELEYFGLTIEDIKHISSPIDLPEKARQRIQDKAQHLRGVLMRWLVNILESEGLEKWAFKECAEAANIPMDKMKSGDSFGKGYYIKAKGIGTDYPGELL